MTRGSSEPTLPGLKRMIRSQGMIGFGRSAVRNWRLRCSECGHRFWPSQSRNGYGGAETFHDRCMAYRMWRTKAEERLAILDLVSEVWDIDARTVYALAEGRAEPTFPDRPEVRGYKQSQAWDRAWRVFYDLDNDRKARAS